MRLNIGRISIFVLLLILSACTSDPQDVDSSDSPTVASEDAKDADIPDGATIIEGIALEIPEYPPREPANPANLEYGLELDNSQTMEIEAGIGGTLTVEGQDGFTYSLEIPPNAVVDIAEVTMTPLSDIGGIPIDGPEAHGVLLEPEGLVFVEPAILTITPPADINLDSVLGFGTFADGEDFHLLPWDISDDSIKINVAHFSSIGALAGTDPATNIAIYRSQVSNYSPSTSQAYYQNRIGQAFIQGNLDTQLQPILGEWFYKVVLPALQNAGNSQNLIDSAWFEFDAWMQAKSRQSAASFNLINEEAVAWRLLSRAYKNAFEQAAELCKNGDAEQAFRMYRWGRNIIAASTPNWRNTHWMGPYIYGNPDLSIADVQNYIADCYRFRVDFRSFVTLNDGAGAILIQLRSKDEINLFWDGYDNILTDVKIRYDLDNTYISDLPGGYTCVVATTPAVVRVAVRVEANFSYQQERAQKMKLIFLFQEKPTESFACIPQILTLWHASFSKTHKLVGFPQDAKLDMDIVRTFSAYATYIYTNATPGGGMIEDEIYIIHTPVGG